MKKYPKRTWVLLAVVAVAAMAVVAGYAWFSSTGTGAGSATVGTSAAWVVGQTATSGPALLPDAAIGTGSIQTKTYHVQNPSAGQQHLNQVDISIAQASGAAWSVTVGSHPACTKDDFSVGGAAVGATRTDTGLSGTFATLQDKTTGSVTVQMIDNGADQDSCKNATPPLYFVAG